MRVLVCDQESEMLETVARAFDVDTATSKATCIDLMRANPFDVVIASERLSDGSGLELLSQIGTRWPHTLRALAIEPERLRLIRGRLAPFRLNATLEYPIDEDELETVLGRLADLIGGERETAEPASAAASTAASKPVRSGRAQQQPAPPSSVDTKAQAGTRAPDRTPPPVHRRLSKYTPLGALDEPVRIVERAFDTTHAPLAARAIRTREAASRPRTGKEKLGVLARGLRNRLERLLKR